MVSRAIRPGDVSLDLEATERRFGIWGSGLVQAC